MNLNHLDLPRHLLAPQVHHPIKYHLNHQDRLMHHRHLHQGELHHHHLQVNLLINHHQGKVHHRVKVLRL